MGQEIRYITISASVSCINSWNLHCWRLNCIYKFQVWDNDQHTITFKSYRILCHVFWYIVTNVMPWQPVHSYQYYAMLTGVWLPMLCHVDWCRVTMLWHVDWCMVTMLWHVDWYVVTHVSKDPSALFFKFHHFKTCAWQ